MYKDCCLLKRRDGVGGDEDVVWTRRVDGAEGVETLPPEGAAGGLKQSKLEGPNEPYLDPLSPLAPLPSSSAFFASAVSGARRMGFEDAPSFMASRTMTL